MSEVEPLTKELSVQNERNHHAGTQVITLQKRPHCLDIGSSEACPTTLNPYLGPINESSLLFPTGGADLADGAVNCQGHRAQKWGAV